jgi:uncharacterized integral membrane protein
VTDLEPKPAASRPTRRQKRDKARTVVWVAAAVVATALVLSNTQTVKIHWVAGTTHAPLIIALAAALLLGIVLGAFGARRGRRGSKG